MVGERCPSELGADEKEGWKIHVKGDCDEVLKDIMKNLGEYGTRYLRRRLVFKESKAKPADEQASPEPIETKVEDVQRESTYPYAP